MIWIIDACVNVAQGPYRALVPDVVPEEQYSIANSPSNDKEHHWANLLNHMAEKYAEGGYMKLWFENSKNAERLRELRKIISDKAQLRDIFEEFYDNEIVNVK